MFHYSRIFEDAPSIGAIHPKRDAST